MRLFRAFALVAALTAGGIAAAPAVAAPMGASGIAISKAANAGNVEQVRWGGFRGGGFRGGWRGGRRWGWGGAGLGLGLATGALIGSSYYYGNPYYYPYRPYYAEPAYYDDEPVYYARPRVRRVHTIRGGAPCRIVSHGHVYRRPGCR